MPAMLDPARAVEDFSRPASAPNCIARIDARFDAMLAAGALDEVRALAARGLDPLLPAMKAHGVPWLRRHLHGEIALDEAAEGAKRTPAATPSARSPGSATRCRGGLGWRRKAQTRSQASLLEAISALELLDRRRQPVYNRARKCRKRLIDAQFYYSLVL